MRLRLFNQPIPLLANSYAFANTSFTCWVDLKALQCKEMVAPIAAQNPSVLALFWLPHIYIIFNQ